LVDLNGVVLVGLALPATGDQDRRVVVVGQGVVDIELEFLEVLGDLRQQADDPRPPLEVPAVFGAAPTVPDAVVRLQVKDGVDVATVERCVSLS
jgi:hypothetical protein